MIWELYRSRFASLARKSRDFGIEIRRGCARLGYEQRKEKALSRGGSHPSARGRGGPSCQRVKGNGRGGRRASGLEREVGRGVAGPRQGRGGRESWRGAGVGLRPEIWRGRGFLLFFLLFQKPFQVPF